MTRATTTISTDTALQVLADRQRRMVLRSLIEADGTATVDRLARGLEGDASSRAGRDAPRDRHRLQLHHAHLPKLQEAGLVEYEPGDETVRYRPSDLVEELLETCSSS